MNTSFYLDPVYVYPKLDAFLAAMSPQSQNVANEPTDTEYPSPFQAYDGKTWGHPNSAQPPAHQYNLHTNPSLSSQPSYGSGRQTVAARAPGMYGQNGTPSPTVGGNILGLVGIPGSAQIPVAQDFSSFEPRGDFSSWIEKVLNSDLGRDIADRNKDMRHTHRGLPFVFPHSWSSPLQLADVNLADVCRPNPSVNYDSSQPTTPSSATFSNLSTPTFSDFELGPYIHSPSASPTLSTGVISPPQLLPMKDIGQKHYTSPSQSSTCSAQSSSAPYGGSPSSSSSSNSNRSSPSSLSSVDVAMGAPQNLQGPNALLLSSDRKYLGDGQPFLTMQTQKTALGALLQPAQVEGGCPVAKRSRENDDEYQPPTKKSRVGQGSLKSMQPNTMKPRRSVPGAESSRRRATPVALRHPQIIAVDYQAGGESQLGYHGDGINGGVEGPEGVSFGQTPQTEVSSAFAEYYCTQCDQHLQRKHDFLRHMKDGKAHGKGYRCPFQGCRRRDKPHSRIDALKRHLKLHPGWEEEYDWETIKAVARAAAWGTGEEMEQKAHIVATR
ncbi:hypothetical protein EVG20_g4253 [Dentipellis fragilis]|uniref:C2H2-type domain-containing protein n=1 Tax=Dentipellis fragilis TaxID=205917 RepID=A0A4Y9YWP6_9AGAM|nr:hypothetical protein EVG20_g4253 [Dentipellis fragilis]